jgi:DNA polymerase III epsilon subunit-like protein
MIKIKLKISSKLNEQNDIQQEKIIVNDLANQFKKYENGFWVFYDTETLGFNREKHQLTQIAAQVVQMTYNPASKTVTSKKIKEFNTYIKLSDFSKDLLKQPFIPKNVNEKSPKQVLNMTDYPEEKSDSFISEKEAISEFYNFLNSISTDKKNVILVGQNIINFDNDFINKRAKLYNLAQLDNDVIDTKDLMQNIYYPLLSTIDEDTILPKLAMPDGSHTFSLGPVAKALGIQDKGWHNAVEDVKMLILVTEKVLQSINKNLNLDVTKAKKDIAIKKAQLDKERREKRLKKV